MAKIVVESQRIEERLGEADDASCSGEALGYRAAVAAALEWSARQGAIVEARKANPATRAPTVRTAIEAYIAARKKRSEKAGANASVRLRLHVLADEAFTSTPLRKLRASVIMTWRDRIPAAGSVPADPGDTRKPLAPSTVNRLLNDVRAALNAAAEQHRRELSPHLPAEIRAGTKALSAAAIARKQVLTAAQVKALVCAAREVGEDGDFGRLVTLAAATGARFSQLSAIKAGDVQFGRARVLVPGSKKGRAARARPPIPVPLSPSVLETLKKAAVDQDPSGALLQRWAWKRAGGLRWEKDRRRAWGPAYEVEKLWRMAIERAGLPSDTVMYALRHTSIVRGLVAGLPIRLVAAAHDTSVEMIEAHYAAFIVDATEDLHRQFAFQLI